MQIKPIYKVLYQTADPVSYLNNLKEGPYACLLESADVIEKYGDKSIGCVDPCLRIIIKDGTFTITALTDTGKTFLPYLKEKLTFTTITATTTTITGTIHQETRLQDEEARLRNKNIFHILRTIAFALTPTETLPVPHAGLMGAISYDTIEQFETLPEQAATTIPDLEFYYADKLFVMDHINEKTYLICNTLGTRTSDYTTCKETITKYERILKTTRPYTIPTPQSTTASVNIPDKEFGKKVDVLKKHITNGDIFQCVLSRTFTVQTAETPLDVYARLKTINPGPYMFYFANEDRVLLGSSPETCLKVSNNIVEIKPIAGTVPRGATKEADSREELNLLLDEKELAEHCMLVDLARNDIAKVATPGTRTTPYLLEVEKFSHVQHLVSTVRGELKEGYDALHAYVATMNMGTLTGAPKIKAMELIRKYEGEKRGHYGGAICYLTPNGEFDSCIVIRAITMENGTATVRAGAGIVYDSDPAKEADETRRKAQACLTALGVNT
ncbi:MAG: anthranilate synthase component 1 [Candidatus Woesearchaeota archaeon]|nr:anthranilate synthase component 1 [Candidatus Woesearchaeota archaeon]